MTENKGENRMIETGFLQADPEYRELSKAVQLFAETGTQQEQDALAYYFEKAMRLRLGLSCDMIEKGVTDLTKISVARYEEIKQTATDFVNRLFDIVDTAMNTAFEKAEAETMQKVKAKLQELEQHGLDEMMDKHLVDKPLTNKAIWQQLGDPEVHRSDLEKYLKKKRGLN